MLPTTRDCRFSDAPSLRGEASNSQSIHQRVEDVFEAYAGVSAGKGICTVGKIMNFPRLSLARISPPQGGHSASRDDVAIVVFEGAAASLRDLHTNSRLLVAGSHRRWGWPLVCLGRGGGGEISARPARASRPASVAADIGRPLWAWPRLPHPSLPTDEQTT